MFRHMRGWRNSLLQGKYDDALEQYDIAADPGAVSYIVAAGNVCLCPLNQPAAMTMKFEQRLAVIQRDNGHHAIQGGVARSGAT